MASKHTIRASTHNEGDYNTLLKHEDIIVERLQHGSTINVNSLSDLLQQYLAELKQKRLKLIQKRNTQANSESKDENCLDGYDIMGDCEEDEDVDDEDDYSCSDDASNVDQVGSSPKKKRLLQGVDENVMK